MTEDARVARSREEPGQHEPAGAERWVGYLDWCRAELVSGVLSLPVEQRRISRLASGWTPIELLSHVLHMEQRWFVWGFLGEPVDEPWGDWDVDEPWEEGSDGRWAVPDGVTAEALAERLEAIGARTRDVLRSYPFDAPANSGGRFGADPPSLEWICFHVLAEYARHAGHLDIAVELAGKRAGSDD